MAARICQIGGYESLLGFSKGSIENQIIKKLGEPSDTSISNDGLRKFISYDNWKVSYQIEKGKVTVLCVWDIAPMVFREEYGANLPTSESD